MAMQPTAAVRGVEIPELQRLLNARSPTRLPRLAVDGVFGTRTLARVREFQQSAGLKVDGLVGPQTLAALKQSPPATGRAKRVCGNGLAGNRGLDIAIGQSFVQAMQPGSNRLGITTLSVGDAPTAPPSNALFRRLSTAQEQRVREVYGESIDFTTVFISSRAGLENRAFTICLERTDIPFALVPGVHLFRLVRELVNFDEEHQFSK